MCGRYLLSVENKGSEFEDWAKIVDPSEWQKLKFGEIYPSYYVPVLTDNGYQIMKWGYPLYQKKGLVINARNETIYQKPMFKRDIVARRCLVLADGYYEWHDQRYYFSELNNKPLYFGACFQKGNDGIDKVVIVTKQASAEVQEIHSRMPVIFTQDNCQLWFQQANNIKLIDPKLRIEGMGN